MANTQDIMDWVIKGEHHKHLGVTIWDNAKQTVHRYMYLIVIAGFGGKYMDGKTWDDIAKLDMYNWYFSNTSTLHRMSI